MSRADRSEKTWSVHTRRRVSFVRVALVGLTLLLIAGCGTSMQLGRPPYSLQLEKNLIPNLSDTKDVVRVLGVPRGGGRVMLPNDKLPRDLWYYYHEESTETEDRRIFLFIFLKQGRYDGYLWFSSLPGISIGRE